MNAPIFVLLLVTISLVSGREYYGPNKGLPSDVSTEVEVVQKIDNRCGTKIGASYQDFGEFLFKIDWNCGTVFSTVYPLPNVSKADWSSICNCVRSMF